MATTETTSIAKIFGAEPSSAAEIAEALAAVIARASNHQLELVTLITTDRNGKIERIDFYCGDGCGGRKAGRHSLRLAADNGGTA